MCRRELPVVDEVANDYTDDVTFLAIAGRSESAAAAEAARVLFSDNLLWGLDDDVWNLYGVRGQPTSLLVSQGVVVDFWFGSIGEVGLRERLDALVAIGA